MTTMNLAPNSQISSPPNRSRRVVSYFVMVFAAL
jgi:hypothetical protein